MTREILGKASTVSTFFCNRLIKEQRYIHLTILRLDSCATLAELHISTFKVLVF